jgi:hypothetical protein
MDAWLREMRAWRKEMTACQEAKEACLENKNPTSVQIESIVVHERSLQKKPQ